jgi:hypothetical protein
VIYLDPQVRVCWIAGVRQADKSQLCRSAWSKVRAMDQDLEEAVYVEIVVRSSDAQAGAMTMAWYCPCVLVNLYVPHFNRKPSRCPATKAHRNAHSSLKLLSPARTCLLHLWPWCAASVRRVSIPCIGSTATGRTARQMQIPIQ